MTVTITPVTPAGPSLSFNQDGVEQRTGGVGGWESLARPRQDAAVAWVGGTEETLALPLILNGIAVHNDGSNRDVSGDLRRLRSWGLEDDRTGEPAILKLTGLRMVQPSERWVIDTLAPTDYTVIGGVTVQVNLTLNLIRYVAPVLLAGPAAKARQRAKGNTPTTAKNPKTTPATKKTSH